MNEEDVYAGLIDWLRKTSWDLPQSVDLIPLIKSRCTPEEAKLMTGMPFSSSSLEELAQAKSLEARELEARLEVLCAKGLVSRSIRGSSLRYRLNSSYFSMLPTQIPLDREDYPGSELANRMNRYFGSGSYDLHTDVPENGLRVLPIHQTLDDPRQILPYEEAAKLLAKQEEICVATCLCKHRKNLDSETQDCSHSKEVCLHFGSFARYLVDHDMGRTIDLVAAQKILQECVDEGLVHGVSNGVDGVDGICNCCRCCCMFLEAYHVSKHSRRLDPSNYLVNVEKETCQGCGLCVKRCPMGALTMESTSEARNKKGTVAEVDTGSCIGCGVCAYKCPSKSLVLERRADTVVPPQNPREYTKRYLAYREAAKQKKDS